MDLGSFSASYVATIIGVAVQQGATKKSLLECVECNESYLSVALNRVATNKVIELIHLAIDETNNPRLGLHIGNSFKPGTFDILGYAVMCSNNLRDAILLNYKYQALNQQLGVTPLKEEGDLALLEWQPKIIDDNKLIPMNEAVISGYAGFGRWITWQDKQPIRLVQFTHDEPEEVSEYYQIFDCDVEFGSYRNAILFDKAFLNTPLQQADATYAKLLKQQLDKRLYEFTGKDRIKNILSCYIQSQLIHGSPTLSSAANALGCGERTLRRRLEAENTCFRDVLNEVRKTSARSYLKQNGIPIADVSHMLGFQNQSAFTHAFKTWFDTTPGQYREHLIQVMSAGR